MEALLSDVYYNLAGTKNTHIMTSAEFDNLFPSNVVRDLNVLRIETFIPDFFSCTGFQRSYGTAVIIDAKPSNFNIGLWDIEALTALHVIGKRTFEFRTLSKSGFRQVGTSTFASQCILQEAYSGHYFASISNNKITGIQVHPFLDMCLVKGQCSKEIGEKLNQNYPVYNKNSFKLQGKRGTAIHYPTGDLQQRINDGSLDFIDEDLHHLEYRINTLSGSSGCPILYKNKLCGIHFGSGTLIRDKSIVIGDRTYGVTDRNKCVLVDWALIQYLKQMPLIMLN